MFLKPLILVDRTFYLDSYHVPYGIWCYIMPLFSYFNLIFYRKVLNINHFSIFSMVWIFFICLFRFFFLRLVIYAKQVFNIHLDQGKSNFVIWKSNQVNFLEKVQFWGQNRCDFFLNQELLIRNWAQVRIFIVNLIFAVLPKGWHRKIA